MRNIAFTAVLATALAGCSSGAGEEAQFEPGEWEISMQTTGFDVPGMAEDELEIVRITENVGVPDTDAICFAESELQGGPNAFVEGIIISDLDCTNNAEIAGGSIGGAVVCRQPGGPGEITINLGGTYDAEAFTMTTNSRIQSEEFPEGHADVAMELTGKRLGDCEL